MQSQTSLQVDYGISWFLDTYKTHTWSAKEK